MLIGAIVLFILVIVFIVVYDKSSTLEPPHAPPSPAPTSSCGCKKKTHDSGCKNKKPKPTGDTSKVFYGIIDGFDSNDSTYAPYSSSKKGETPANDTLAKAL